MTSKRFNFQRLRILTIASLCSLGLIVTASSNSRAEDSLSEALEAVLAVAPNGSGHESAVKAMKTINAASADQIPSILKAMDGANKISLNWLRSAVVSISSRSESLPNAEIRAYFDDQSHGAMGRLLAFDLLTDGNQELADRMIANLTDDPSLPLRRKAIGALIKHSDSASPSESLGMLSQAMTKARDVAQIQMIAGKLNDLGLQVDLQKQMGFIGTWHIVGSFDNKDMAGFDVAYGPEKSVYKIDLTATYQDLNGDDATWKEVTTGHETGSVDLNSMIGKVKGATVYAVGKFNSPENRTAEIRIGSANATKIWLNGTLVMSNEIYHNSNSIDKFIGTVELQKGDNQILIKVCQNEQTESWAQDWQYQLRICDETGKPISAPTATSTE
ncbi:MAG: hypothetical protein ACI814_004701 [Mariniblastus sp.]|jgi:hypothetical protein